MPANSRTIDHRATAASDFDAVQSVASRAWTEAHFAAPCCRPRGRARRSSRRTGCSACFARSRPTGPRAPRSLRCCRPSAPAGPHRRARASSPSPSSTRAATRWPTRCRDKGFGAADGLRHHGPQPPRVLRGDLRRREARRARRCCSTPTSPPRNSPTSASARTSPRSSTTRSSPRSPSTPTRRPGKYVAWADGDADDDTSLERSTTADPAAPRPPPRPSREAEDHAADQRHHRHAEGRPSRHGALPAPPGRLPVEDPAARRHATVRARRPGVPRVGAAQLDAGARPGQHAGDHPQRRPESTLAALEEHARCDALVTVPIMLSRLLDLGEDEIGQRDLDALRIIALSGSALSADLATRTMDLLGDVVYNLYGSTEVAYATIATPADLRAAPGTVGRPPHGTPVKLLDDGRQRGAARRVRAHLRRQLDAVRGLHRRRQQGGRRRADVHRRRRATSTRTAGCSSTAATTT